MRTFVLSALSLIGLCGNNIVSAQSTGDDLTTTSDAVDSHIASPTTATPNPYEGDLLTRHYLTGDWNGRRSRLAERGVTMDIFATQFYQGVTSGALVTSVRIRGQVRCTAKL